MVTRIARPWRESPTARPKARPRRTGMSSSAQISMMFVQALGFSNGWAELAFKKPPPLVPSSLIDLLARHRAQRDGLLGAFERRHVDRTGQRLRHAERDEDKREYDRDRQQDVEDDARHIDPEIADRGRGRAREGAHERERHREARRGGQEVVDGEAEHLREMTHRRLAAVVLPVGVGDEADRGVERQIGRNGVEALRIERQYDFEVVASRRARRSRRSKRRSSRSHR